MHLGDLSHWDTSNVRDMSGMFEDHNGVIGGLVKSKMLV
ncbi:hypothetical protein HC019_09930 [Limosilactobacillus fermentum]